MLPESDKIQYTSINDYSADSGKVLVDVRLPDVYGESHIPGSVNFCVYEVAFNEKIAEAYPDTETSIIVYGESAAFKAAESAVYKLQGAGYQNVSILEGGLHAWQVAGNSVDTSGQSAFPAIEGKFALNLEKTKIRWIGRNLVNQHDGKLAAKSGSIEIDASGAPIAGELIIDMSEGITCDDLTDAGANAGLIGHLQSPDFFETAKYPEASFTLISAEPLENKLPGSPNFAVKGTMQIKGLQAELHIPAMISQLDGGVGFQAQFDFDRTKWNVLYGSGSIFEKLGMHLVNNLVSLQVMAFFE